MGKKIPPVITAKDEVELESPVPCTRAPLQKTVIYILQIHSILFEDCIDFIIKSLCITEKPTDTTV